MWVSVFIAELAKWGLILNFIITPIVFALFLTLKLTAVVSWSWLIVLSPLMGIVFGLIGIFMIKKFFK